MAVKSSDHWYWLLQSCMVPSPNYADPVEGEENCLRLFLVWQFRDLTVCGGLGKSQVKKQGLLPVPKNFMLLFVWPRGVRTVFLIRSQWLQFLLFLLIVIPSKFSTGDSLLDGGLYSSQRCWRNHSVSHFPFPGNWLFHFFKFGVLYIVFFITFWSFAVLSVLFHFHS